jgi:hypothetical protein
VSFISALNLDITPNVVRDTIINGGEESAVFEFKIFNNGVYSDFEIYTFERFNISQSEFTLSPDSSRTLEIEFIPFGSLKNGEGHVPFPVYFLNKGGSDPVEVDISIELVELENAFGIRAENITLDASTFNVNFFNRENIEYEEVEAVFRAPFLDESSLKFSLGVLEDKRIQIPVSNVKLRKLVFGDYVLSTKVIVDGEEVELDVPVKISEKSVISSSEEVKGLVVRTMILSKTNDGNALAETEIVVKKNIISRLFTTFSVEPVGVERDGFSVYYSWMKEDLQPNETFQIKATTNWFYPLIIVLLLGVVFYFVNLYYTRHLVVKKQVAFVKTKSGDFALRVTLRVRANKFMEHVRISDRLPAMAQLYEKYGSVPSHVNKNTGSLQWDFKHLANGEERILTYIFYSKLKVIGKFELPSATGFYEIQGNRHEAQSNRVFFINEPEPQNQKFGNVE